ncbi:MAG: hypothetical protein WKF71_11600 [Pyrinomonadaceae bacterium]
MGWAAIGSVVPTPGGAAGAFHAATAGGLIFLGVDTRTGGGGFHCDAPGLFRARNLFRSLLFSARRRQRRASAQACFPANTPSKKSNTKEIQC